MSKKEVVAVCLHPMCLHPMDQAFDQDREDGSGRRDRICGVCGETMCEVLKPNTELVDDDPANESEIDNCATCPDSAEGCGATVEDREDCLENMAAMEPTSYVTRDPDHISESFTRHLPVPVPDEELAEHAKEMARIHSLWCKTKLDAKAYAKGCKNVTDKAEDDMVTIAAIIEEGTEERPVICRWEFNYSAGTKQLRRMDTHQIISEETLQGEELHLSFNFNGSSESAVEKLAAVQADEGLNDAPDPCEGCATEPEDCPVAEFCDTASGLPIEGDLSGLDPETAKVIALADEVL